MIRNWLFYIVVILIAAVLLFYSTVRKESSLAIVAEVEPQKTVVSFHKPVRIKELHVSPGQHIKKGDPLITVERPDLELDIKKVQTELQQLENNIKKRREAYQNTSMNEKLKLNQDVSEIDRKISELKTEYQADSVLYSEVNRWMGNDSTSSFTSADQLIQSLENEKNLLVQRFKSEENGRAEQLTSDLEDFELTKALLNSELEALREEEATLVQYALFDGSIGSLSGQLMELIPAFETIISIYNDKPNLIKGYMNEQTDISVLVGDQVSVESISRDYQVQGEIIEIGSRIVSYPKQMNPVSNVNMWGKEVFVTIPEENEFLNGEKVYVIIRSTN